jgi:hypothetical protein
MNNKLNFIALILFLLILSSCDNFQEKLFNKIDIVNQSETLEDTFDIAEITDFEWDSVLLIMGNESTIQDKEYVEDILNNKMIELHWEEDKWIIDKNKKGIHKSDELPIERDGFYFLTNDKKIIVKEIDHYNENQGRDYKLINLSKDTIIKTNWISRKDSKIVIR